MKNRCRRKGFFFCFWGFSGEVRWKMEVVSSKMYGGLEEKGGTRREGREVLEGREERKG